MYGKRQIQVENFSKQKNEQIKTAQKILMDKKLPGTQGATNLLPPQGFHPEGEIPRRHSGNSRVY